MTMRAAAILQAGSAISSAELCWALECELEALLLAQGRQAVVRVWYRDPHDPLPLCRIDDAATGRRQGPLHHYLDIGHARSCIRDRVAARPTRGGWMLASARCTAVHKTFSRVVLSDPAHPDTAHVEAALPHGRRAVRDPDLWPPRGGFYVAATYSPRAGDAATGSLWLASRSDSVFLRLLCRHFLSKDVAAELYGGMGMLVFAPHADLAPVIGRDGRGLRALEAVAGLRKLYVVRRPVSPRTDDPDSVSARAHRLRAAIKSFGLRGCRVTPPLEGESEWTVHVRAGEAKHVLGVGGTKLLFISRLSGLHVQLREETQNLDFQLRERAWTA